MNARPLLFIAIATAAIMVVQLPAQQASADELASILGELQWGANKNQVLTHIKREQDKVTREKLKSTRDSIKKDRIRRKARNAFAKVKDSWTPLRGSRTKYDVSVVGDEFERNNGEALLLVKDDIAQKYYFFLDEKLSKVIVVYSAEYLSGVGFDAFVDQVTRKYGEPDETEYDIKDDLMIRAIWRDDATELRIDDKSDFYGTYTMSFGDKAALERLKSLKSAFADKNSSSTNISADIKDIQEDDGFSSDSNVVDNIVGGSVEVNLERGRPEEAELIRVGSDPNAAIEAEKKKKRKRGKVRKGRKKGVKKKAKNDDLVIY